MKDGGGDILRFLLVDDHGGKIPAEVSQDDGLYEHFDYLLHEEHWKIITGFTVQLSPPGFRFAQNHHSITFTENTDLQSSGGIIRDHYMNFKDYIGVMNGVYNSELSTCGLKNVKDHTFTLGNDKKTSRVKFWIKNLGGDTLECKAYGVLAIQLYDKWWRHGGNETFITMSDLKLYTDRRTNEIKIKDVGGLSRFQFTAPYQDVYEFSSAYFGSSDGSVDELIDLSP
ncbi:unnamed protein product [Microthlaspi erraticum]|uniref:Replication protein A 70 kDa DNA-binding subunit B/D first OB fold domain-containing protein n=1 Tax=Microthlaspi erraticum TaxID=1685480 RepID=A0A6D2K6V5_9BRAS|nr:unnamed protein product [Microthlaspi erraticum]